MHLLNSLVFPSFVAFFALQAVAVGTRNVKLLTKRDDTCPDTPAFLCIFIPPGVSGSCSSTCGSSTLSNTATCTSNSCVCNSNVISTYAACLQCAANNYVGNDPDVIQPFLDDLVDNCQEAGISVSASTITAGHPRQTAPLSGGGDSGPRSGGGDGPFDDDDNLNTGLAIGAIIGIAVAIPLGSFLIFGLIGLLCANHAKNRRKQTAAGYYNLQHHY